MDSRILFKVSFFEENTVIFLLYQELCGVFSKIQLPGLGKKEGKKDKKTTTNKAATEGKKLTQKVYVQMISVAPLLHYSIG